MNLDKLIERCLIFDDAVKTQPFKKDEYKDLFVIRHKNNNKWFALIYSASEKLFINLKCEPDLCPIIREQYEAVTPAWHMNKKHWNSVDVNNIPKDVLDSLIEKSYLLTLPKKNNK